MIIWLASYPRSGNTYFRIVVNRRYGVETFSVYTDRRIPDMWEFVGNRPIEAPIEEMEAAEGTFIVKTHELPDSSMGSAIYLVRDGRDALVSHAHFVLSFETIGSADREEAFRRVLQNLIVSDDSFGGWSENVNRWLDRPHTQVVRFDDLIADPDATVDSALGAAGYPVGLSAKRADALPQFAELHERMPRFFRRGQVGSWRTEMPDHLHELFWERHGHSMRRLGYAR